MGNVRDGAAMGADEGSVTAVVLTWREVGQTLNCVEKLLASDQIERLIVVDNESTGALSMPLSELSDPRIELVQSSRNLGFSAGVNLGLLSARAQKGYRLVINNDAYLLPDDLSILTAELEANPWLRLVAPRIVDPDGNVEKSWGALTRTMRIDRSIAPSQADYFTWACVLFRSDLLEEVGYLDERFFMYWEDVDFGRRIKARGLPFRHVPSAVAVHATSSSHASAGAAVQSYYSHGLVVLSRKEGSLALGVSRAIARVVIYLLRLRSQEASASLRGIVWALIRPDEQATEFFPSRSGD